MGNVHWCPCAGADVISDIWRPAPSSYFTRSQAFRSGHSSNRLSVYNSWSEPCSELAPYKPHFIIDCEICLRCGKTQTCLKTRGHKMRFQCSGAGSQCQQNRV